MALYDLDVTVNFRFTTEADSYEQAYDWANQWQNRQQRTGEIVNVVVTEITNPE
jgi:hypothetical protein